jgi:hypothetical protein
MLPLPFRPRLKTRTGALPARLGPAMCRQHHGAALHGRESIEAGDERIAAVAGQISRQIVMRAQAHAGQLGECEPDGGGEPADCG